MTHSQADKQVPVKRSSGISESDSVAVEEPLEIRIGHGPLENRDHQAVAITMRTPGHDEELALGFLFSEGIISSGEQVRAVAPCGDSPQDNAVRVELAETVDPDLDRLQRNFYTTSSCGVCGKQSLEALRSQSLYPINPQGFSLAASAMTKLPEQLRRQQEVFSHTGALHAAASFDQNGQILAVREDVGRHNALDKLIGSCLQADQLPMAEYGILVSGRASFELAQKAMMAGCPMLVAIGGPSSLAIDTAQEFGLCLVGFLRAGQYNIYTSPQRVQT
jgi:FdhD protein